MERKEILEKATACVLGQRELDYGKPEDNFRTIGDLWTIYVRAAHQGEPLLVITPEDVGIMMALLKVARIASGSSPDSFVDLAGYAACAGEIATNDDLPY